MSPKELRELRHCIYTLSRLLQRYGAGGASGWRNEEEDARARMTPAERAAGDRWQKEQQNG